MAVIRAAGTTLAHIDERAVGVPKEGRKEGRRAGEHEPSPVQPAQPSPAQRSQAKSTVIDVCVHHHRGTVPNTTGFEPTSILTLAVKSSSPPLPRVKMSEYSPEATCVSERVGHCVCVSTAHHPATKRTHNIHAHVCTCSRTHNHTYRRRDAAYFSQIKKKKNCQRERTIRSPSSLTTASCSAVMEKSIDELPFTETELRSKATRLRSGTGASPVRTCE